MANTIDAAMRTHLDGEVTKLATCWQITRIDGTVFRYTSHDRDIPYAGNNYVSAFGFERTNVDNASDMSVDNVDVRGIFDDTAIKEDELRAGLFDGAEVRIFEVNWTDPDTYGDIKLRRGWLGEAKPSQRGWFEVELRGMNQELQQTVIDLYQTDCRVDLGDPSTCKLPIQPSLRADSTAYQAGDASLTAPDFIRVATAGGTAQEQYENRIYECTTAGTSAGTPPTFDTTVGNTTVDGTVTWTCRQAWTRSGNVAAVTDARNFTVNITEARAVDDWFNDGVLTWETGNNAGVSVEVKDWVNSTGAIELFRGMPFEVQAADKFRLYPGCDKRKSTCKDKFQISGSIHFGNGNVLNYHGDPFIPGADALQQYPSSRS